MKQNSIRSIMDGALYSKRDSTRLTDSVPSTTTLLEIFIPGYGPIHNFFFYKFGFDITNLVSIGTMIWLTLYIGRSSWARVRNWVINNWTSEISVSSNDEIFTSLCYFLSHKRETQGSRRLQAETINKSAWEIDNEFVESLATATSVAREGETRWLHFSDQDAQLEPEFTPDIGYHRFWYDGTYFNLHRRECTLFDNIGSGEAPTIADKEKMTISCFGRSPDPIKRLFRDAKACYHSRYHMTTIIKRPNTKDLRRFGGRSCWIEMTGRPCRPMNTVVLDEYHKSRILNDMNEYLNPATAIWYADRGIPYRRGYLLHGPPGTGKSSLSFALAGFFGLDIHVISLADDKLTEEELGILFANLPVRCIVLIEDVDAAGLTRNKSASPKAQVIELADEKQSNGISLSGLLNVIDGMYIITLKTVYLLSQRRRIP